MVAGGTEAGVTAYCMAGLDATRALSRRNDDARARQPPVRRRTATASSRPRAPASWCSRAWSTRRRAAPRSSASWPATARAADAYHLTEPDPSGRWQVAAMRVALQRRASTRRTWTTSTRTAPPPRPATPSRSAPSDSSSATSAPRDVMVSSTKSMHGHGMGAAGGLRGGADRAGRSARARVPPTINVDELDGPAPAWTTSLGEAREAARGRGPLQLVRLRRPQRRARVRRDGGRVNGNGRVRVAMTGIGVVCPLGIGREEMWALRRRRRARAPG